MSYRLEVHSHARSHRETLLVWPDFQLMRVPEKPVCIHLIRQNPVFISMLWNLPFMSYRLERFRMQGGKNWILPKVMNATRFFWDSHWLEIWSHHFCSSMEPNGGSVAMDSERDSIMPWAVKSSLKNRFTDLSLEINHITISLDKNWFSRLKSETNSFWIWTLISSCTYS